MIATKPCPICASPLRWKIGPKRQRRLLCDKCARTFERSEINKTPTAQAGQMELIK